ncbi:hypothetical protein ACHQM5_013233 [Ranunculus cassubicifolius]
MRVLSPKWRYLSAFTPNLQFDLSTLFGIDDCRVNFSKDQVGKLRFVRAVDEYVHLCTSPKANSLMVHYCLGNEFASNVDRWISFAMRLQVEQLELNFSPNMFRGGELYNFPHHLLSQVNASHLMNLSLESCTISQIAFDEIFSGCANLQFFRLRNCRLPLSLSICSARHLKLLAFYNCIGVKEMELSICLATFDYWGDRIKLRFVGASLVERVCLLFGDISGRGKDYIFYGLSTDLPQLQSLSLFLIANRRRQIPTYTSKFCHLKELELFLLLDSTRDIFSTTSILNVCPCLQKFHLGVRHENSRHPLVNQDVSEGYYYKLREIEISGFRDRCNLLDFAIYLINHAVGLERMIIDYKKLWTGNNRKRWSCAESTPWQEIEKRKVENILSSQNQNVELLVL